MKTLLARLFQIWILFAQLVHRIMAPVQLGIVFFLFLTPIALLMRLFKIDPLRLKSDPKLESYWIEGGREADQPDQMKYQF